MLSSMLKIAGEGWWRDSMTMQPELASDLRVETTCFADDESRPLVGSSKRTIFGFVTISIATETRRRSPPEMPRIRPEPPT